MHTTSSRNTAGRHRGNNTGAMSLRKHLIKPFVVSPSKDHSHTVIFLHRFPQDTVEEELPAKVLSAKLTKNHKTLSEQYPTIRWVFPHPKLHPNDAPGRPRTSCWSDLSHEDVKTLELPFAFDLPYVTQVIVREAELVGGLDKIILGGQGDGALAAHDACTSFPELPPAHHKNEAVIKEFLARFFHGPGWSKLEHPRMAGVVGMHANDGPATRDESDYLLSQRTRSSRIVNRSILKQTPHKFIRGGYKTQTITWDGARIDTFASFLTSLGIRREGCNEDSPSPNPLALTPMDRPAVAKQETKPEMTPQQRYMEEIMADKKADQETRRRILMRIEEDKRNRKYRQEREKADRQHAVNQDAGTSHPGSDAETANLATGDTGAWSGPELDSEPVSHQNIPGQGQPRRQAMVWENWATMPEELRTEWEPRTGRDLTEAQARALGVPRNENDP